MPRRGSGIHLDGGFGDDWLFGQAAVETLYGDNGNDFLHGESHARATTSTVGRGGDVSVLREKRSRLEVEATQLSGTPPQA